MGKALEHENTFRNLNDVERWKFLRKLPKDDYVVMIDYDCTYVIFYDDDSLGDTICDFDFCVGNSYGVKHLLTLLHIHFEEV
jgi:hypothetical protein